VVEQLVTARIIEPTSKQDAARVLAEAGVRALSYRTVKRRLPRYARQEWRDRLSGACAARAALGPSALVLYDVTTLWFETDAGNGFREPGFSKERRLAAEGSNVAIPIPVGERLATVVQPVGVGLTAPARHQVQQPGSWLAVAPGQIHDVGELLGPFPGRG
jgi:hypothetical protein